MARLAYPEKHTKIVCLPKYFLNVDRNKNVVKVNIKNWARPILCYVLSIIFLRSDYAYVCITVSMVLGLLVSRYI